MARHAVVRKYSHSLSKKIMHQQNEKYFKASNFKKLRTFEDRPNTTSILKTYVTAKQFVLDKEYSEYSRNKILVCHLTPGQNA